MESHFVWAPHEDDVFTEAEVIERNIDTLQAKVRLLKSGAEIVVATDKLQPRELIEDHQISDNLAKLEPLNDASILHAVRTRARLNEYYTRCGETLIAVNPFKTLPIYDATFVRKYHVDDQGELPPHLYSIGKKAIEQVKAGVPQSIVISGESGAGKTESTKYLIRFLTHQSTEESLSISDKIDRSNPLLEAFGNAKTLRNNNSSRFGKYIVMQFDDRMQVQGAFIETYLLEKSRVVKIDRNERNYHIFYQLLAGLDEQSKTDLHLEEGPQHFHYLNQSESYVISGIDDSEGLESTKKGFDAIGVSEEDQKSIFNILAGILHLGNIVFTQDGRSGCARISNPQELAIVSRLLGIDEESLAQSLLSEVRSIKGDITHSPYTAKRACEVRDTISKIVYQALFDWLVNKVNESIGFHIGKGTYVIGILDIFGFESFESNGLEQLCINYANECLHQLFVASMFKDVQAEYRDEGINWTQISYVDNQDVLDLIGGKTGIMDLLDDYLSVGFSSDDYSQGTGKFLNALLKKCTSESPIAMQPRSQSVFTIKHFAGNVKYSSDGMMEKNAESIRPVLLNNLLAAKNNIIVTSLERKAKLQSTSGSKRESSTITKQFRRQLENLFGKLKRSHVHYVKCIKPTESKNPDDFQAPKAAEQLRYSGVLQAIRMSRSSYPVRKNIVAFQKEIHPIAYRHPGFRAVVPDSAVLFAFLSKALAPNSDFQIGRTKIYMQICDYKHLMQAATDRINHCAVVVQSRYKATKQRRQYQLIRSAGLKIQNAWRAYRQRKIFVNFQRAIQMLKARFKYKAMLKRTQQEKKIASVTKISSWFRGLQMRRKFLNIRKAAIAFQKCYRRRKTLRNLRIIMHKILEGIKAARQNNKLSEDLNAERMKIRMLEEENIMLRQCLSETQLKLEETRAKLEAKAAFETKGDRKESTLNSEIGADVDEDENANEEDSDYENGEGGEFDDGDLGTATCTIEELLTSIMPLCKNFETQMDGQFKDIETSVGSIEAFMASLPEKINKQSDVISQCFGLLEAVKDGINLNSTDMMKIDAIETMELDQLRHQISQLRAENDELRTYPSSQVTAEKGDLTAKLLQIRSLLEDCTEDEQPFIPQIENDDMNEETLADQIIQLIGSKSRTQQASKPRPSPSFDLFAPREKSSTLKEIERQMGLLDPENDASIIKMFQYLISLNNELQELRYYIASME
eukprot:TRINITY_DN6915_c0_g1_i5.p1 TRINITY_DN6915_c0_g1~~TRINITY_DN6915_c0_g1_i5.p1  ORF type:complete len:1200 (+),score=255.00 TRINITY_DN6915_c0_g1_i5:43-3642(+)